MEALDPLTPSPIDADTHHLRVERAIRIAEDDLRRRMVEQVPQIRHEAERMENVLREIVNLERLKIPPEIGRGYFTLYQEGRSTYSGQGNIGPKQYNAKAISAKDPNGNEILKITLFPT